MNFRSKRSTVIPVIPEDELEPPAYDQIHKHGKLGSLVNENDLVVSHSNNRRVTNNDVKPHVTSSVGNRRRLSRVAKWMRQSVNSLTNIDENGRIDCQLNGINKRWRWYHQKRISALQRELQLNPMLPFECIRENCMDMLRELLKEHQPIINQPDPKGSYLIHHAIMAGNLDCVELLVSYGADINIKDAKGNCPVHLTAMSGNSEILQYLIDLNVDMCCTNNDGLQPIHIIAERNHYTLLEKLLGLPNIDIETKGERGATAVHYCCATDSAECLKILISHGAQIYVPNQHHSYPIHIALENLSHRCLNVLLESEKHVGPPVQVQRKSISNHLLDRDYLETNKTSFGNQRRSTARVKSSEIESYEAPKLQLINLVDSEGDTPLHTAVRAGDIVGIKTCLEYGASILVTQNERDTPVHYACSKSDLPAVKIMLEACPTEAKMVLAMANKSGYTVLHLATLYDHVPLLDYLVENGALLEQTDSSGLTSLLLGVTKGSFYACHRLMDLGANVLAKDANERNIVHLMVLHANLKNYQLIHPSLEEVSNILIFQKDSFGCTPLHYTAQTGNLLVAEYLLNHGVTLLDKNAKGDTPLHLAAHHGYYKIAKCMLDTEEGMRALYYEDNCGRIPLHRAVMQGHTRATELLLEKGGIFRKCHAGNTPLHTAAYFGQLESCQVLLKLSPALLDQKNFEGLTALHAAAQNNHAEIVDYLLTAGAQLLPANDGYYFVCMALERKHHHTLQVTIMHSRWPEIWSVLEDTKRSVLDGLIRELPNLFQLIMSRSIITSIDDEKGNVNITYDFSIMQQKLRDYDDSNADPMHRVKLIARLQRRNLLFHPLCRTYLDMKWKLYGRWIQFAQIFYFLLTLAVVTSYVLNDDELLIAPVSPSGSETLGRLRGFQSMSTVHQIVTSVLLLGTTIHLILEMLELKRQSWDYFRDWTNTLELVLFLAAETLLIDSLIDKNLPFRKTLATFLMFLAWFNFLLQLTHVKYVGIFIVMFLQVFGTVIKCLSVYSIVILAFGFAFHVLLRDPNYKFEFENYTSTNGNGSLRYKHQTAIQNHLTERDQYNYLSVSLFKTLMMMFGEYEHSNTLIYPLLSSPHKDINSTVAIFIFYIAFLVFVPIIVMNLLIGLAVGDIEEVRKTACQQLLIQQIYWLADLESKFPKSIQRRLTKKKVSTTVKRDSYRPRRVCDKSIENNVEPRSMETRIEKLEKLAHMQNNLLREILDKVDSASPSCKCRWEIQKKYKKTLDKVVEHSPSEESVQSKCETQSEEG